MAGAAALAKNATGGIVGGCATTGMQKWRPGMFPAATSVSAQCGWPMLPAGPRAARPGQPSPAAAIPGASAATVVDSPWPVLTTVSGGSVISRSEIDFTMVGKSL